MSQEIYCATCHKMVYAHGHVCLHQHQSCDCDKFVKELIRLAEQIGRLKQRLAVLGDKGE